MNHWLCKDGLVVTIWHYRTATTPPNDCQAQLMPTSCDNFRAAQEPQYSQPSGHGRRCRVPQVQQAAQVTWVTVTPSMIRSTACMKRASAWPLTTHEAKKRLKPLPRVPQVEYETHCRSTAYSSNRSSNRSLNIRPHMHSVIIWLRFPWETIAFKMAINSVGRS